MVISKEQLSTIKITPIMDSLKLSKIEDAEYFSKKYSNYISNSRLSLINPSQDNDPKAFFEGLSKHSIYSDSLTMGSAVHELCLQKELFHLCFDVDRPTAKAAAMADMLYDLFLEDKVDEESIINASNKVDYYKGKMNQDKIDALLLKCQPYWEQRKEYESKSKLQTTPIYLDPKGRDKVQQCVHAVNRNNFIQKLLHPEGLVTDPISENEQAILLDIQVEVPDFDPFILKLKSKLDNYTIDTETGTVTVNDLKTLGKILPEFPGNVKKFHYSREMALYSWLMSLVAKKYYNIENCTIKSNYLVVSTIPDYYTKVFPVTKKELTYGWNEAIYLLRLVAYYCTQGYEFS